MAAPPIRDAPDGLLEINRDVRDRLVWLALIEVGRLREGDPDAVHELAAGGVALLADLAGEEEPTARETFVIEQLVWYELRWWLETVEPRIVAALEQPENRTEGSPWPDRLLDGLTAVRTLLTWFETTEPPEESSWRMS